MALDQNDRTMVERVDPLLGSILDRRFRIDFRLAAGGFGAIYRATHVKSKHEVALKVLHPQLATDRGVVARFRREGATLTTLRNPHTIIAYELGEADDGTLYIVMELLRGESLYERYRARGRFEWPRMVKIARQVCASLEEAHGLGIVHRDLKPTNIHLEDHDGDPDFVKVLDFGIAKILRDSDFDSSDLTNVGQMIGTLDYMSPEQMVGSELTGQSDIYTLGIVIYEMIAGARPFDEAPTPAAALAAILKGDPPSLSQRAPVPPQLDAILARCLARDPLARYGSVAELGAALDALLVADDGDEITRTVTVEPAGLTAPMDVTSEPTMFAVPPPPTPAPARTRSPASGVPAQAPAPASARAKTPTGTPSPHVISRTPVPALSPAAADPVVTTLRGPGPARAKPPTANPNASPRSAPVTTPPPVAAPTPSTSAAPVAPPFVRPLPTPPSGLPSASPFKTTLPGAERPANPSGGGAQPLPTALAHPFPPTPAPAYAPVAAPPPRAAPAGFDMAQVASRDAAVSRLVWIVVLVVAAIAGIVAASQL